MEKLRTCYLEVCHFHLHITNLFDFGTSTFWYIGLEEYSAIKEIISQLQCSVNY